MSYTPKYLGHVNIFVRNAERSHKWYADVLGLHTYDFTPGRAAFLSADLEQSHEVALIEVGDDAPGPQKGQVGLNHMAWMMESLEDLQELYQRLIQRKRSRSSASPTMGSPSASISTTPTAIASRCPTSCPGASGIARRKFS